MKKYRWFLALLLVYAAMLLAVDFRGDFPLNDDWAYAYSVKNLCDTGKLRISDWASATLVFQALWGFIFCKLAGGFSFTVLRFSTLALGFLGLCSFYLSLIELDFDEKYSLIGVCALLFNPFWLLLNYSFMTDAPYLSLAMISTYFYLIAVKNNRDILLFAGSVMAGCAVLTRQIGIFLPAGTIIYLFAYKKLNLKKLLLAGAVPGLLIALYYYWLNFIHGILWSSASAQVSFIFNPLEIIPRILGTAFYAGFFILPFSAAFWFAFRKEMLPAGRKTVLTAAAILLSLSVFVLFRNWMPYFGDNLSVYGFGKISVYQDFDKASGFFHYNLLWILLTAASAVSFATPVLELVNSGHIGGYFRKYGLFLVTCGLTVVFSLVAYKFWDRYLIVLLPVLIFLSLEIMKKHRVKIYPAVITLVLFAVFSITGTADYMSWNRAKWKAGELAIARGAKPEELLNGLDWGGWFTYNKNMEILKAKKNMKDIGNWDWADMNKYKAMVSFSSGLDKDGWKLIDKVPYKTPLSAKTEYLYLWYPGTSKN